MSNDFKTVVVVLVLLFVGIFSIFFYDYLGDGCYRNLSLDLQARCPAFKAVNEYNIWIILPLVILLGHTYVFSLRPSGLPKGLSVNALAYTFLSIIIAGLMGWAAFLTVFVVAVFLYPPSE